MDDENKELKPGLYIVSLPIGNSKDITLRRLNTYKVLMKSIVRIQELQTKF